MQFLSDRINALEESATLAMAAKARELKSKGIDIISLSLGEPDFKTPKYIQEGAIKAVNSGNYFAYPPVAGYPDLRQAISDKLNKENNIPCKPENIVVSAGAKQSIANAIMCLVNPGDEVIVYSPYWVSYAEIIKLAEGVPVLIHGGIENDFKASADQLKAAITPKTKAVMYSSPSNPTGAVFSKYELEKMVEILKEHKNIFVIADEIYEYINFDGSVPSMASFPEMYENTITVNGFSKGYAMTGWRVGYIAAPLWIAKACEKMQGQITSGICSIAQRAAYVALTEPDSSIQDMVKAYANRKEIVMKLLKEIPGIKTSDPSGAFYFFPDVSSYFGKSNGEITINNADDLSMYILNKAHVSVVTGAAFGDPSCIRISFAASEDNLREAVKRIKEVLVNLK
jgi:aspartate aminotransferase